MIFRHSPILAAALAAGPVLADGNVHSSLQIGFGNFTAVRQDGSGLDARTIQVGSDNQTTVDQSGTGHLAITAQIGSNHEETIVQDGDDPRTSVSVAVGDGHGQQLVSQDRVVGARGVAVRVTVGR